MYVTIGPTAAVRRRDIVGIFDLDNVNWSHRTRKSLAVCEKQGCVVSVGEDLPRALVVCSVRGSISKKRRQKTRGAPASVIYMTQLSAATLEKRVERGQI